jgi:hypothetical protein
LSLVHKGIQMCREQKLDINLAVGGGSVIDSAKAIAAGVPYQGDVWDFFVGKAKVTSALPVGTVLTIPAAGSETSGSTVVTNEDGNYKKGLTSEEFLRPVFSILNPELTKTLPVYETAVGAADIMSHVFERYFTNSQNVDFSDRLCEAVLKGVIRNLPLVLAKPGLQVAAAALEYGVAHPGQLPHPRRDRLGPLEPGERGRHNPLRPAPLLCRACRGVTRWVRGGVVPLLDDGSGLRPGGAAVHAPRRPRLGLGPRTDPDQSHQREAAMASAQVTRTWGTRGMAVRHDQIDFEDFAKETTVRESTTTGSSEGLRPLAVVQRSTASVRNRTKPPQDEIRPRPRTDRWLWR